MCCAALTFSGAATMIRSFQGTQVDSPDGTLNMKGDSEMNTTHETSARTLTQHEIDCVAGGTQLYSHQFTYINYQNGGLRPFEPSFADAVNDATMPVTK